jgi:[ribosomal protein S5]-alanine N-acetyltransferase
LAPHQDEHHLVAQYVSCFALVHTGRLVLRRVRIEDGSAMFTVHGDPATNLYNPSGPDPDRATSDEALHVWLQDWEGEGYGYWAITLSQSENVLGFGGVRRMIWRDRDVLNLYYRLTPGAWGQGYASEVAQKAVALARKHLPFFPVVARTRAHNLASIRVAERTGLQRHPELDTEHIVFTSGWT